MKELPSLNVGYYHVLCELNVHKTPGLSYVQMTKQIKRDSRIVVRKIQKLRYSVWGEVDGGWICLYMNQRFYVKRVDNLINEITYPLLVNLKEDEAKDKEEIQ